MAIMSMEAILALFRTGPARSRSRAFAIVAGNGLNCFRPKALLSFMTQPSSTVYIAKVASGVSNYCSYAYITTSHVCFSYNAALELRDSSQGIFALENITSFPMRTHQPFIKRMSSVLIAIEVK